MNFKYLLFIVLLCSTAVGSTLNANLTLVDDELYMDYAIKSTNKVIYIPTFEMSELIYLNCSCDFNYLIENSTIIVYTDSNDEKFVVLKYISSNLLQNEIGYEKTITLNNYFDYATFNLDVETKITKTNGLNNGDSISWIYNNDEDIILLFGVQRKFDAVKINLAITASIAIILFLLFQIIRRYYSSNKLKNRLTDNEYRIISLLHKQDGIMQQSISETLDLQKSHVSKIISKLEKKELIEKKQIGKIKKIFLKS